MSITAAQVKELRERTQAGMMECKKALEATKGNMDLAIEELRKSGRAKADKKASRVAAEGVVIILSGNDGKEAAMVEVNCETDFVARDENFLAFANQIAKKVLSEKISDVSALDVLNDTRQALIAKVGENINVRRAAYLSGTTVGTYSHGSRIGVIVEIEGGQPELAKDIAMHIAASKPIVIAPENVPGDLVAKEKEIYMAQAAGSGKPQEIIEKMVAGKLKKFLDEISLLGQPFVKDPDVTVANLLGKNRAKVLRFIRFEVGEGIEKETEDFVEAVMAQVKG